MAKIDISNGRILEMDEFSSGYLDTEGRTISYAGRGGSGTDSIPEYLEAFPESLRDEIADKIKGAVEENKTSLPEVEVSSVVAAVNAAMINFGSVDLGCGVIGTTVNPRKYLG